MLQNLFDQLLRFGRSHCQPISFFGGFFQQCADAVIGSVFIQPGDIVALPVINHSLLCLFLCHAAVFHIRLKKRRTDKSSQHLQIFCLLLHPHFSQSVLYRFYDSLPGSGQGSVQVKQQCLVFHVSFSSCPFFLFIIAVRSSAHKSNFQSLMQQKVNILEFFSTFPQDRNKKLFYNNNIYTPLADSVCGRYLSRAEDLPKKNADERDVL